MTSTEGGISSELPTVLRFRALTARIERVNGKTKLLTSTSVEDAMPAVARDRLSSLIRDVESAAKRLRNEVRKRANATQLQKNLQNAAGQLRKAAAQAVGQVEKYVQNIRKELEKGTKAAKAKTTTARRPAKRRRTTRRKARA